MSPFKQQERAIYTALSDPSVLPADLPACEFWREKNLNSMIGPARRPLRAKTHCVTSVRDGFHFHHLALTRVVDATQPAHLPSLAARLPSPRRGGGGGAGRAAGGLAGAAARGAPAPRRERSRSAGAEGALGRGGAPPRRRAGGGEGERGLLRARQAGRQRAGPWRAASQRGAGAQGARLAPPPPAGRQRPSASAGAWLGPAKRPRGAAWRLGSAAGRGASPPPASQLALMVALDFPFNASTSTEYRNLNNKAPVLSNVQNKVTSAFQAQWESDVAQ